MTDQMRDALERLLGAADGLIADMRGRAIMRGDYEIEDGKKIATLDCGNSVLFGIDGARVAAREALASAQPEGPVAQQFITPILPTGSREAAMVVIKRDASGTPTVWCDPEIVDLVRALNDAGIATVASCSGHGHRPGRVSLADGRELVIARGYDEARRIDGLFSTDINGEKEKGHAE